MTGHDGGTRGDKYFLHVRINPVVRAGVHFFHDVIPDLQRTDELSVQSLARCRSQPSPKSRGGTLTVACHLA